MAAVLGAYLALVGSPSHSRGNPEIQQLQSQGNRAYHAGQFKPALDIYREVFRRASTDGDIQTMGRISTNIGAAELAMYHYQGAISAFLDAEQLAWQAHDQEGAKVAVFDLASLYVEVKDFGAADLAAQRGLAASRDPFGHRSLLLAIQGRIRYYQGRGEEAVQLFHRALDAAVANGDPSSTAVAWQGIGEAQLMSQNFQEADQAFSEACRIRIATQDRDLRASYLWLSATKVKEGDPRAATRLLNLAEAMPATGLTFFLWKIDQLRGEISISDHKPAEALAWFRKSIEAVRIWRDDLVQNDAVQTSADEWLHELYGPFIETSISLSESPHLEAFLATEENRAASLRHTLTASRSFLTRVPSRYWEIVKQLRSAEGRRLAKETRAAKTRVDKLRQELAELEARTGVGALRIISKPIDNKDTGKALRYIQAGLTKGEALLSFYLGSQSSALWAVTDRGCEFHTLPRGTEISSAATKFNLAVEAGSPDRDKLGSKLYTQLFSSLSADVRAKPDWIISSSDTLFNLPFAALRTDQTRVRPAYYLAEAHSTSRVPSALMLRQQNVAPATGQFLGIGDGIYNTADPRYKRPNRSAVPFRFLSHPPKPPVQLARLVGSTQEIQTCSKIWNGLPPSVLLTGPQATLERFKSELPSHPEIIHIATHVMAPPGSPEQALINFGLSPDGQPEVLTNSDIATLDVSGSTIIMNGCASAGATAVTGAGVMGLTRSWILAGARTIIGTRWPISEDTGVLFEAFYLNWKQNRGNGPHRSVIARALQQAQIKALRSGTWRSDPKYWSAFYVVGKD